LVTVAAPITIAAYQQLRQWNECKDALQRSLDLHLSPALATTLASCWAAAEKLRIFADSLASDAVPSEVAGSRADESGYRLVPRRGHQGFR
jgi:hypothetical protein